MNEISAPAIAAIKKARIANPDYTVVVTGYSLGAAVVTLAAAYLRAKESIPLDLYTYGSPRVGNNQFTTLVSAQAGSEYRITYGAEPFPRIPPIISGYRHTFVEYWLQDKPSNSVNYTVADIRVCEGTANVNCNGSTLAVDFAAHGYYFQEPGACTPKIIPRQPGEPTDEELEAKLNAYAMQDI
ncbi:hypothetical protein ACHAQH_009638 [Verticillium albo-atrum]